MADPILPNARIDQLDLAPGIEADGFFVYRSVVRGRTEKVPAPWVMPTGTPSTFEWAPDPATYVEDQVVTYQGQWWQAQQAVPVDIIPGTDGEVYWVAIPKASSGLTLWAAGIFVEDECFVLRPLDGYYQLFRLASATRPYPSTDFEVEFASGDWELMSERGYIGIPKTAHGFAVNDVLTYKTGAWNKFASGDNWLAIVVDVVNANLVIAFVRGQLKKGLTGLTAGTIYYIQADGTIADTPADDAIFMAVSTTTAIFF